MFYFADNTYSYIDQFYERHHLVTKLRLSVSLNSNENVQVKKAAPPFLEDKRSN